MRRHGDALQKGITKADLKPYRGMVEARIAKNSTSPVWAQLEAHWGALVGSAEEILTAYHNGRPGLRHEVRAAHEIKKLGTDVEPREVVVTILAMYVMQQRQPRLFRSDNAYSTQLVRRVRGMSDVNVGEWYDSKTRRTKRVYRELPPNVAQVLATWLASVAGVVGIKIAELEMKEEADRQEETNAFYRAVAELT